MEVIDERVRDSAHCDHLLTQDNVFGLESRA